MALNRANIIQYMVEKYIQPLISVKVSSVLLTWNQMAPAIRAKPSVCTQFNLLSIRAFPSIKLRDVSA